MKRQNKNAQLCFAQKNTAFYKNLPDYGVASLKMIRINKTEGSVKTTDAEKAEKRGTFTSTSLSQ